MRYTVSRGTHPEPWNTRLHRLYGGRPGEGARFVLLVLMLALVALLGGSSWPNAWPLLILRPAVILLATAALMLPGPIVRQPLRVPGLLIAALALVMMMQLVPLPPGMWAALPGHAPYAEAATAAAMGQPWRPITLSIDKTLNSLVSLIIPAALLLGTAALRPDQRTATGGLMLGIAVFSALLGLLQVTLGGSFYPYARTSVGRPAGLFVNINHQAAVLAAAIPLAAAWAVAHRSRAPIRAIIAAAAGTFLFATILVTGSRSGLLLAVLAVLAIPLVIGNRMPLPPRIRRMLAIGMAASMVALVLATWMTGRLGGLERLLGSGADQRLTYLPITLGLLRRYSPFGSGFGTFDAVFRQAEPDTALKLTYFNHAHNDLLELGITGGLAAVVVALVYLAWLVRRGTALFRTGQQSSPLARAGLFAAVLLLLASLVDYPLRTPLAAAMLTLATLWVADWRASPE